MYHLVLLAFILVSLVPTFDANVIPWTTLQGKQVSELPEADAHFESIATSYRSAESKLGIWDNDGCLKSTGKVITDEEAKEQLRQASELLKLAAEARGSEVWVITARNEDSIKPYLDIKGVNFGAEQGTVIIRADRSREVNKVPHVDEIREVVKNIIDHADSQKPINLIPMVNSVPLKFDDWENTEHVRQQIRDVLKETYPKFELKEYLKDNVAIVHNPTVNKKTLVERLLRKQKYDFAFSVGDDIIDEGMHEAINALKGHSYSIVVSENPEQKTAATHKLATHEDVYRFFTKLYSLPPNAESPP
ncbi:hypothetical protein MJO29_003039 [Puccinia striiformis f. sp. tritici]|uniref:hypothetical protein n=1 Tax=Puccinia striiformis f. sp. tritici TaxID=168172 RepID=UPI0020083995|nr:hypothetical protein Pst134EA_005088 [Puccinia striiformis f. sp. tritici]KAH9471180.1 hypothetical protein Pst134EA_005088 [Puccinia striiformis f. sp. tritici]KAI7964941.1 hypothetical protein MJO29_003039 [Puccinia striiformis f. sp. tritici]